MHAPVNFQALYYIQTFSSDFSCNGQILHSSIEISNQGTAIFFRNILKTNCAMAIWSQKSSLPHFMVLAHTPFNPRFLFFYTVFSFPSPKMKFNCTQSGLVRNSGIFQLVSFLIFCLFLYSFRFLSFWFYTVSVS